MASSNAFRSLRIQLIAGDDKPALKSFRRKSLFFAYGIGQNLSRVVGDAAPEMDVSKYGQIWEKARRYRGHYQFDLAIELPFFLPRLRGASEYTLRVGRSELLVSMRMFRAYHGAGYPETDGWNYILLHEAGLPDVASMQAPHGLHPLPIRTFISQRVRNVVAASAHTALHDQFREWQATFVSNVSRVIDAFRDHFSDAKHLFPHSAASAFPIMWVATRGATGVLCEQFVGDVATASFRTSYDAKGRTAIDIVAHLRERRASPPYRAALALARTSAHYGHLGQALVQLCTAAESALAKTYRAHLLKRGVSDASLRDHYRDITLSQLTNLHLHTMCDLSQLLDAKERIASLNWARKCRNSFIHAGRVAGNVTQAAVEESINTVAHLISFVVDPRNAA